MALSLRHVSNKLVNITSIVGSRKCIANAEKMFIQFSTTQCEQVRIKLFVYFYIVRHQINNNKPYLIQ